MYVETAIIKEVNHLHLTDGKQDAWEIDITEGYGINYVTLRLVAEV